MNETLSFSTARRDDAPPGAWFLAPVGLTSGALFGHRDACTVNIKCPKCGKSATLREPLHDSDETSWPLRADGTRGHTITSDGVVTPSVVCPYTPCDWHVHVRLDGWATARVAVME